MDLNASSTENPVDSSQTTTELSVEGMTCNHCVASVTEELSEIPTVTSVQVELNVGGVSLVTVSSDGELDTNAARTAVTEAGYTLVSR